MARKKCPSCCPPIRVKCHRKHRDGGGDALLSASSRRQRFVAAKKKLRAAYGFGNIHPAHEATSLPAGTASAVAHAASNPASRCTVTFGRKSWKKLTGAQAAAKVAQLVRQQKAHHCMPRVVR